MQQRRDHLSEVRQLILDVIRQRNTTLAAVSRAIGRNHAYLHQFVNRRTPRRLPEDVRHALADHLNIDERSLADPALLRTRTQPGPAAPPSMTAPLSGPRLSTFAARLSIARAESEYETPSAFARAANIDRARYADLEDGEQEPTLGELYRIFQVSKKPLEWLIQGAVDASVGMIASGSADRTGRSDADFDRPLSSAPGDPASADLAKMTPRKRR